MNRVSILVLVMCSCVLMAQNVDIQALIGQLSDANASVREKATEQLVALGAAAQPATQALIQVLADDDYFVVCNAIEALGNIGYPAKDAAPILIELLGSKWAEDVHRKAAKTLGQIGGDPKIIAPVLVEVLMRNNYFIQIAAKESLLAMKAEALPLLLEKLSQNDTHVREVCIRVLKSMGTFAKPAVPALITLLHEKRDYINMTSADALVQIGTESIPEILEELAKSSSDFDMQNIIARSILAKMDEDIVVPVLIQHILDPNVNIRVGVLGALERINPEKKLSAIPKLIEAATHVDETTRLWVAIVFESYSDETLQKLDEKSISAIVAMHLLNNHQGYSIEYSKEVLLKLGKSAASELIKAYHAATTTPEHKKNIEKISKAMQIQLVAADENAVESILVLNASTNVDPIYTSRTIHFIVEVANQGTIEDTNVFVMMEFPEELIPTIIINTGIQGKVKGQKATFEPLAVLQPNQKVQYKVEVYTMSLGNPRIKITLMSDKKKSPIHQEKEIAIVKQKVIYHDDDED